MFSHPRTSINPFPYNPVIRVGNNRPTFTVPAVPRQPCRSCWKTITEGHSLHECLREKRKDAQKRSDREFKRDEFIAKNNLTKRTPNDPCISCRDLFGQDHTRGNCSSIRNRELRDVRTTSLFKQIRQQLGLDYTAITRIPSVETPRVKYPTSRPKHRGTRIAPVIRPYGC